MIRFKILILRNVLKMLFFNQGIEPTGNLVDAPTKFNVETLSAGHGDLEVIILNPKGQKEPVNYLNVFY